MSIKLQH